MVVIKIIILIFATLGALDYIIGNRFGIGKEFVNGIMLMGTMLLTMQGMLVISPLLADLLEPAFGFVHRALGLDPSIIPASFFANDMGGAPLSKEIMIDSEIGMFNALVVSSMMGCTISFTIPFSLGLVPKEQHRNLLLGLLCGIVTIPVGCFVGGLVCGIAVLPLLINLLPLILLSALIAVGLLKFPGVCVKIFSILGLAMKALIIVGLVFGMAYFLTGFALFPEIGSAWDEGILVCTNAAVFLAGAFPLVFVVSRLLRRPLRLLGRGLRINETSALCLLSSLASSSATFGMMKVMDDRGCMLNAAFAVSGAFVFAGHLAFTVAFDAAYVPAMVVGKLVAGVLALLVAVFISARTVKPAEST